MRNILNYLVKSFLAGVMIATGGTVFLSCDNKVIGASLFSIGLFVIVVRSLNLYTGKVGYIFDNKPSYLIEVLVTIVGNFIGTFAVGNLLHLTRVGEKLSEKAAALCQTKLDDSVLSILFLSVCCGILMYLAVNGYRDYKHEIAKYISVYICVVVFILCGFEHSIANMYYFSVASMWSVKSFGYMGIMILGNAVGGVVFPLCKKLVKEKAE
ncbi:MAG: formate/nitrite transporter family protein [Ruminococcaceae bacterium]|jgi:formate/nitrite transporter FocA (FNT family)|nr:formate/nitrite transporter family protein [Oscillospiraceae bacterium]